MLFLQKKGHHATGSSSRPFSPGGCYPPTAVADFFPQELILVAQELNIVPQRLTLVAQEWTLVAQELTLVAQELTLVPQESTLAGKESAIAVGGVTPPGPKGLLLLPVVWWPFY